MLGQLARASKVKKDCDRAYRGHCCGHIQTTGILKVAALQDWVENYNCETPMERLRTQLKPEIYPSE